MNRMDQALSQNGEDQNYYLVSNFFLKSNCATLLIMRHVGYQPNSSPNSTRDRPRVDLPANAQGLHTPEALSIVLRQAEQLLSSHTVAALSVICIRSISFCIFYLSLTWF